MLMTLQEKVVGEKDELSAVYKFPVALLEIFLIV